MQKFKIFIVEDEEMPLQEVTHLLENHKELVDIDNIIKAKTYEEAEAIISTGIKVDLLILDRKLPDNMISFSLITPNNAHQFGLIAVNTQDQAEYKRLVENRGLSFYHLIRKPYNEVDINQIIQKLITIQRNNKADIFVFNIGNVEHLVRVNNIVYIQINNSVCTVYFKHGDTVLAAVVKRSLKSFKEVLNPKQFFQINKSEIFNIDYYKIHTHGRIILTETFKNLPIELELVPSYKSSFFKHFH